MPRISVGWVVGTLIAAAAITRVLVGCTPAVSAEARYTAALLRCVDKSETLAESKACRKQVDAAYGITETVAKDGGK